MLRKMPGDVFHPTIKRKDSLHVELVDDVLGFNRPNVIANFLFLLLSPRNYLFFVSL